MTRTIPGGERVAVASVLGGGSGDYTPPQPDSLPTRLGVPRPLGARVCGVGKERSRLKIS